MHNVGEKPGKGRYCRTNCGWSVRLDDHDDRLPPCRKQSIDGLAGRLLDGQHQRVDHRFTGFTLRRLLTLMFFTEPLTP